MDPVRWSEIERLVHSALARPVAERAAYVAEACGSDDALRHEVETLLASESMVEGYLSAPVLDKVAQALPISTVSRSLFIKDLKVFLRDVTQWSQLLLLLAVVGARHGRRSPEPPERVKSRRTRRPRASWQRVRWAVHPAVLGGSAQHGSEPIRTARSTAGLVVG